MEIPEKLSETEELLWLEWIKNMTGKCSSGSESAIRNLIFENPDHDVIKIENNKLYVYFDKLSHFYEYYQISGNRIRVLLKETKASYENYERSVKISRFFVEFSVNRGTKTYDKYRESFRLARTGAYLSDPDLSDFKPFSHVGSFTKRAL